MIDPFMFSLPVGNGDPYHPSVLQFSPEAERQAQEQDEASWRALFLKERKKFIVNADSERVRVHPTNSLREAIVMHNCHNNSRRVVSGKTFIGSSVEPHLSRVRYAF